MGKLYLKENSEAGTKGSATKMWMESVRDWVDKETNLQIALRSRKWKNGEIAPTKGRKTLIDFLKNSQAFFIYVIHFGSAECKL